MSSFFSRLLSYALHPLLMPFYAVFFIFYLNTYLSYTISPVMQRIVYIVVFLTTFAMPALTAILLYHSKSIKSLEMEDAADRTIPFITTTGYYFICFWLLRQLPVPRLFSSIVLGAAFTIFIALIINRNWKISIHMIGIGGIAGCLIALSQFLLTDLLYPLLITIIAAGLLGWARLAREAHTPGQIYSGFFIGLFVEWIFLNWMNA